MITCNRCGKVVQVGLATCQNCGMPLSNVNMSRGGVDPGMDALEQPQLPAWLESLRASEQPGPSSNAQPGFNRADLFDEGTLPSWMRPQNAEMAENGNSGKYPAWRPASMPAPTTDGEFSPPGGFAASSLIDEQSLPSWMQGNSSSAAQPPVEKNFSAASLVHQASLPDWMQNLPQAQQSAGSPQASLQQASLNAPAGHIEPMPAPSQRISADDLIDRQALPPWLTSGQPGQAGYAGQEQAAQQVRPSSGAAPSSSGGEAENTRIGASSLLDMNALPNWLRESEQAQNRPDQMHMPAQNLPYAQSQPGPIPGGGNLTAASLIDMNALPGWLRSAEDQTARQQGAASWQGPLAQPPHPQEFAGNSRPAAPGSFNTPPRVDSIRVPSRPRGEPGSREQSEVAATVFSSMLGVASSAPYFPPHPSQLSAQDSSGPQQGLQENIAAFKEANGSRPNAFGVSRQPDWPTSSPQTGNAAPAMPPGFQGMPGGNQEGYAGYAAPSNTQPARGNMSPMPTTTAQKTSAHQSGSKPARRGIIDTIREWFTR